MIDFINRTKREMFSILKDLCSLSAPSHSEQNRAKYCKEYLENIGAKGVYIDDALNVIYPYNCSSCDDITAYLAHTDTVFSDITPMPYFEDEETIRFPGVGDNSASVAVLLLMAKYFVQKNIKTKNGILFVFNSCEEGLGNLKGTRKLFSEYGERIKRLISFDSNLDTAHDRCVGSHRYSVEVKTTGGHSYNDFGTPNAIFHLSEIVTEIYKIKVPEKPDTKTTYNVGEISGGTSVNTIAQSASMLCEYRSDDIECLSYMQEQFTNVFNKAKSDGVDLIVKRVGDRPCADIDAEKIIALKNVVIPIIEKTIGSNVKFTSASTDCNIPLSLGVPALCVGVSMYEGMHTREETLFKNSLEKGLSVAISIGLELSK